MDLTAEQLEILIGGLQQHDFTRGISLPNGEEKEAMPTGYPALQKRVLSYMKSNYRKLGIDRNMNNFTPNHPINLLTEADAQYIAEEGIKTLSDKEQTVAAVEQFFDMFGGLFIAAIRSYCKAKIKGPDDLNDEDLECITKAVVDVVNEELTNVLMQGQQFPTLYDVAHQMQTHEDFADKFNPDAINFYDQWTHCKTAVGAMLSLGDENAPESLYEDDQIGRLLCNAFCETLSDIDAEIFHMREEGRTQAQIAERFGYKTHSAVTKRLKEIKKRWDAYMEEVKPE